MNERYIEIPLEKLVKAPWNYKSDNARRKEKLRANIEKNGQIENLIVREMDGGYYEVVNGNHRYDVFIDMGVANAVCCNLGKITQRQAERIAGETNELRFEADALKFAELVDDILKDFPVEDLAKTMPYETEDLLKLQKSLHFDVDQLEGIGAEPLTTEDKGEAFKTVTLRLPESVAAQFNAQVDRFKRLVFPDLEDKELRQKSYVMPIEAMLQHLSQMPDDRVI